MLDGTDEVLERHLGGPFAFVFDMSGRFGVGLDRQAVGLTRCALFAFDDLLGVLRPRLPAVPTFFGGRLPVPVLLQLGEASGREEIRHCDGGMPCFSDGQLGVEGLLCKSLTWLMYFGILEAWRLMMSVSLSMPLMLLRCLSI